MDFNKANTQSYHACLLTGTDKFIAVDFNKKLVPGSIKGGKVGFMSSLPDAPKNPTYREVCGGRTGHVEGG